MLKLSIVICYQVTRKLDEWTTYDAPRSNVSHWRELGQIAIDIVGARIVSIINDWEMEYNIITGLKTRMVGKFKHKFENMEVQIHKIESKNLRICLKFLQ